MKKVIDYIIDKGYKIILIFSIICLFIALIGGTFFYINRSHYYMNPFVIILGSIVYIILLSKLYRYIIKLDSKKKKIISICLLIGHFILLLVSTFVISSVPKVDLIHILIEINSLNDKKEIFNNLYFSVYPNNRFLLMFLYGIQKIIPINHQLLFCIISSISIFIMTFFTYKTLNYYDENKGLLGLFITVLSPIFYLYVSYYYTDVLMLPFASILIYLMVRFKDTKGYKTIIYSILIGVISVIGYKIRAVSIFLLIAYLVYLICNKTKFKFWKYIFIVFVSMFLTLGIVNKLENNLFVNIDKEKKFPMTHWIMMGVNEKNGGYYSQDDFALSESASNFSDRVSLNKKVIKERISSQGLLGNLKLIVRKINVVWGKGDYSYQKYLDLVRDYNVSYFYLLGDRNVVINYLLQFSKIVVLIFSILSLLKLLKDNKKSFVAIAIFGAIVFYLVWEVCPRYGLSFLPWLIVLGSYSYDYLDKDFDEIKYYKYFKYLIILLTFVLLILGFLRYENNTLRSDIVSKSITSKIGYVILDKNDYLEQELKLNSKFNKISIKLGNVNDSFRVDLLDGDFNLVYSKEFTNSDVDDKGHLVIDLEKQYDKGVYYFKISDCNNLYVDISYKEFYDYYPEGDLTINNEKVSFDLLFKVENVYNRKVYSYLEYLVLIILCFGIEYMLLFKKRCVYEE